MRLDVREKQAHTPLEHSTFRQYVVMVQEIERTNINILDNHLLSTTQPMGGIAGRATRVTP